MRTLHLMQLVCGQANKVGPSFGAMLCNDLGGLNVAYSLELAKWISVTVSGPDEELAADLLTRKYGKLHDVRRGEIVRAWLAKINDTMLAGNVSWCTKARSISWGGALLCKLHRDSV